MMTAIENFTFGLNSNPVELATFTILILGIAGTFCRWAWLKWYIYPNTFKLAFPQFPYGDPRDTDADRSKTIGLGQIPVQVRIQVRYALEIRYFNFRFVNDNGSKVPRYTIKITGIHDQTPNGGYFFPMDDGQGGRDCIYSRLVYKGKNEYLRFDLDVEANREWDGLLSFMGHDREGKRAFARQRFKVSE